VSTNSYCFRENTYVIKHNRDGSNEGSTDDRKLIEQLLDMAVVIPLQ